MSRPTTRATEKAKEEQVPESSQSAINTTTTDLPQPDKPKKEVKPVAQPPPPPDPEYPSDNDHDSYQSRFRSTSTREIKLNPPEEFDRHIGKFKEFLQKCLLNLQINEQIGRASCRERV